MNSKKIAQGRRGEIRLDESTMIARKKALSDEKRGPLLKESRILAYLNKHTIDFVPQIQEVFDDGFSYTWIPGEHFIDAYTAASDAYKKQLLHHLLDRAYDLDLVGVIHGELLRPFTNVLVDDELQVSIIDFERGTLEDFSGKNTKHVMQRLSNQGFLDVPTLRGFASLPLIDLVKRLKTRIDAGPVVSLDQGSSFGINDVSDLKEMMKNLAKSWNTEVRRKFKKMNWLVCYHFLEEAILHYSKKDKKTIFLSLFEVNHHLLSHEGLDESWDRGVGLMLRLLVGLASIVGLDQITKILFVDQERYSSLDWITPTINTGIARSIPLPFSVIIAISFLFLFVLLRYAFDEIAKAKRNRAVSIYLTVFKIGVVLLLGGGVGNLIDRVVNSGVRDFIDLNAFLPFQRAIFNVADIAISVGVIMILWRELRKE